MLTTNTSRLAVPSLVGVVLAAAAITPAAASAATPRYASPSGSGTVCSSASPCTITQAVTAATLGDTVTVKPGDYPLTATLSVPTQITIHGVAGQPRPRLQFSGASQNGLRITYGSTLRYVEIDQAVDDFALFSSDSTVDQVVAKGSFGAEIQNSTIRDSLVVASGNGGVALETVTNGGTNTSTYRNVTAIATGSKGVAIHAEALGATGHTTINLSNAIARSSSGPSLEVSTDNSGAHATLTDNHTNSGPALTVGSNAVYTAGPFDQAIPPAFVNPAAGNYHEAAGSPTIGAGVNDPLNGTLDVDGDPRSIGVTDIGADEFVLAPTAATGPAGSMAAQTATLTGTVNPEGAPTSYRFQYGATTSYGTTTGASNAGAGATAVAATAAISGLSASTTYHYRIKATNAAGVTYGVDHTFTTTTPPPPPTATPTPTPTPIPSSIPGFAGVKLVSTKLTLAHGFITAWLKCLAATTGHCTGQAKLTVRHPRARSQAAYTTRLGRVAFAIAAGKQTKVRIRASRSGRKLFTTARRHKATATIRAHDAAGQYKTATTAVTITRTRSSR